MPPAKKRKFNLVDNEPAPLIVHIFHLPGHIVDVKLSIFDTLELHVHSAILKLHIYDDDGSWSLFDVRNIKYDNPGSNLIPRQMKRTKKLHETAFINFIGTLYGKSWVITDIEALKLVTELADYYCALPAVSKSMHGALLMSPIFCKRIFFSEPSALLDLAVKLRSPELFWECMICLVGKWQDSAYQYPIESQSEMPYNPKLANPKLNELAIKLHNQICTKTSAAQQKILDCCQINSNALEVKNKIEKRYLKKTRLRETEHGFDHDRASLPEYFRAFGEESSGVFALAVSDILQNRLIFNKSLRAGDNQFSGNTYYDVQSHFLCAEIKDEDLPWDLNETDW
ncbi:hypothetical protein EAE96_001886 [Botrytis aclada]|nr:hypothetical protein EAE96_001886 [Botrytis aclada]